MWRVLRCPLNNIRSKHTALRPRHQKQRFLLEEPGRRDLYPDSKTTITRISSELRPVKKVAWMRFGYTLGTDKYTHLCNRKFKPLSRPRPASSSASQDIRSLQFPFLRGKLHKSPGPCVLDSLMFARHWIPFAMRRPFEAAVKSAVRSYCTACPLNSHSHNMI